MGYEGVGMAERKRLRQSPVAGGRAKEYRVAVTAEQREELERLALAEGVTVPRYLVQVGLNRQPQLSRVVVTVAQGVKQVMTRDRANLNQLAHQANVSGLDQGPYDKAMESYVETNGQLRQWLAGWEKS
jgi:hypothetical protein